MSDKTPPIVRKVSPPIRRIRDPRVARSTWQLGDALVQLMLEREFPDITIEDILRRAGVSRSTFYAHYRNKNDVLYSSYERMFGAMEHLLTASPSGATRGLRVVPVAEFCQHVGNAGDLITALQQSGHMDDMWDLACGFVAAMIERRIAPKEGVAPAVPPSLIARMLAGAFLEMVRWWLERKSNTTPQQLDDTFHEIAWTSIARASYQISKPQLIE